MGHLGRVSGSDIKNFVWVLKHLLKRQHILHDKKGLALRQSLNLKQLGGSGACSSMIF